MKRVSAMLVLAGYLLLVPYCFFGAAMTAHAHDMGLHGAMTNMDMSGCAMPGYPCQTEDGVGMGTVLHHGDMYHAITDLLVGVFPILALIFIVVALCLLRSIPRAVATETHAHAQRVRYRDIVRAFSTSHILSWLSLRELSPAPAL